LGVVECAVAGHTDFDTLSQWLLDLLPPQTGVCKHAVVWNWGVVMLEVPFGRVGGEKESLTLQ